MVSSSSALLLVALASACGAAAALAPTRAAAPTRASSSLLPVLLFHAPDGLELLSACVRATFNLSRGALDVVQGRFECDGDFAATPSVAGGVGAAEGAFAGALSVRISGAAGGERATSSFTRAAPLPFVVLANGSGVAAFAVTLGDDAASPFLSATLTIGIDAAQPRALAVSASATALAAFSPALVSLATAWTPPNSVAWYDRGVRQGFAMPAGFIASASPLHRYYAIGDGATGAVEVRGAGAAPSAMLPGGSFFFAGVGESDTNGGVGLPMAGAPAPLDSWMDSLDGGATLPLAPGDALANISITIFPNGYSFPPSEVPSVLPPLANITDLRAILTAVHGSAVSALHSYDYAPEVRAAPCLVHAGDQCYAPLYNFYDPDSGISNSAMLYSFDADVLEQVRGQLETNMRHVCGADDPASLCEFGQCIHHFVGNCNGMGAECTCVAGPGGVEDCVVYDAISSAVQSGPNVFTLLAALRYAGTAGNLSWLALNMPTMRSMMHFLDARFDAAVGLYLAPGSLQIDVFIRANYTSDTNAAVIILCELFADAETALGNATGSAAYMARAAAVRVGMNKYLLAADGSHYCTQSDPVPGGGVRVCARDFVDYDANALAVAARAPVSAAAANAVLARMDAGACTHAGRATYVSEIEYDAANCVDGNIGDSAVTMGRIAWQDALARQAVGDAAAAATFEGVLLQPLLADLLRRTWLPERFTCEGKDAHSSFYFEYGCTVALMLYEVKYGISLRTASVIVDPLSARSFDFAMGGLWIGYYNGTGFHAQLPAPHSGTRAFTVTRMQPGTYRVERTGLPPLSIPVAADGMLRFTAAVGAGMAVDATMA